MLLEDLISVAFRSALELTNTRDFFVEGLFTATAREFSEGNANKEWESGEVTMANHTILGFLDPAACSAAKAAQALTV